MSFEKYAEAAREEYRQAREEREEGVQVWPEGWYPARIEGVVDPLKPKRGGKMMRIDFKLRNPDTGKMKSLSGWFCYEHDNPMTEKIARRQLGQLTDMFGVSPKTDWPNERLMLKLRVPKTERNDAGYENDNDIGGFRNYNANQDAAAPSGPREEPDSYDKPKSGEPEDDIPF